MIIAINISVLISTIGFYTPDADGIRNGAQHSLILLTGSLVPISLMPDFIKNILLFTPFPSMAFMPTYILQTELSTSIILGYLSISVFWSIILTIITSLV